MVAAVAGAAAGAADEEVAAVEAEAEGEGKSLSKSKWLPLPATSPAAHLRSGRCAAPPHAANMRRPPLQARGHAESDAVAERAGTRRPGVAWTTTMFPVTLHPARTRPLSHPQARAASEAANASQRMLDSAENGEAAKVEQFLDAGVDVETVSARKQETALHLAAAGGFMDVAAVLLKNRASANVFNKVRTGNVPSEGVAKV